MYLLYVIETQCSACHIYLILSALETGASLSRIINKFRYYIK